MEEIMFNRTMEWRRFASIVDRHVVEYTVPQYGDSPDDEVQHWSVEQCVAAIQKYTRRFGSNQRGNAEIERDMLKIAHFACLAYFKLLERNNTPVSRRFTGNGNDLVHGKESDDTKQPKQALLFP
jgi:hypothetical protein